jgi:hypothetical protein
MSLHTLANHIQSAGRGDDKMLVHMTPNEVHGLQSLAKAHGGALTTNPETGLPEAGFLSSILPMVAGLGLSMIPGVGPLMAAGIVGGGTTLATGSLQKGLMAGLGAYGGAGLGGLLAPTATTAATTAAAAAPTTVAPGAAGYAGINVAPAATTVAAPAATTAATTAATPSSMTGKLGADFKTLTGDFTRQNVGAFIGEHPYATTAALGVAGGALTPQNAVAQPKSKTYMRPYENTRTIDPNVQYFTPYSNDSTAERNYFTGGLQAQPIQRIAAGGLTALAVGGPVEQMSAMNSTGGNTMYPQANLQTPMYSNPMVQRPVSQNVVTQGTDTNVDPYTGEEKFAIGGVSHLGDYSDGGRLLRGPGDGVSDSIPASIGNNRPARLADGEFVVPARIVSELGNGSTEAGARKLYAMMDRVQKARKKSVGQKKVAVDSKAEKLLPA